MRDVDPKVEEAIETLNMKDGPSRRRLLTGTGLVSATAAASALLAACSSSSSGSTSAKQTAGDFPSVPAWKFTFVNHVTTNPFFVPTQDGLADGNVGDPGTNRLAYIGQDLFVSGQNLGQRIASSMPSGGDAVGFIATPGTANIQPRIDGAKQAIGASGKNIKFTAVASGATLSQENTTINSYVLAHKSTLKGIFAVDAGSTQTVGQIIPKYGLTGKVASGGFDLTPQTLSAIKAGNLDFTIDQQPYLQGFLPVLYLYLFNLSGGLVNPAETNTGLTFVTKANVGPYLSTTSRYEGSTTAQKYIKHTGAIA